MKTSLYDSTRQRHQNIVLAAFQKPASKRLRSFKIGEKYDPFAVGLAVYQGPFASTYEVGDCAGVSGHGNCGHEYATDLSADDQSALLEYLKAALADAQGCRPGSFSGIRMETLPLNGLPTAST